MTYPAIAIAAGVANAAFGIVLPSWPHLLLGIVVVAYGFVDTERPRAPRAPRG